MLHMFSGVLGVHFRDTPKYSSLLKVLTLFLFLKRRHKDLFCEKLAPSSDFKAV